MRHVRLFEVPPTSAIRHRLQRDPDTNLPPPLIEGLSLASGVR